MTENFFFNYKTSIKHVIKYLNDKKIIEKQNVLTTLYNILYKSKTKIIYDNTNIIMLAINNKYKNMEFYYKYRLNRECNGLLLKLTDHVELIMRPPESIVYNNNLSQIHKFFDKNKYRAYEVIDGTMIHLYYNDTWLMSTSKILNLSLDNEDTPISKDVMDDILQIIDLDKLNKKYAYTFTIQHPLIQCIVEDPNVYYHFTTINGMKVQEDLEFNKIKSFSIDFNEIINIVKSPLDKYTEKFKYGVILRNGYNENANIFIESKLHKLIRETFYENMHTANFMEELEKRYRLSNYKPLIKKLFPQWSEIYSLVDEETEIIIQDMLDYFIDQKPTKYPKLAKRIQINLDILNTPTDRHKFEKILRNIININGLYTYKNKLEETT